MKTVERTRQLSNIMHEIYAQAKVQADFTAEMIAERGQVSAVRVYRLIGSEFKELRGKLPGPRRSPSTVEAELRAEIVKLKEQIKSLKAERERDIQDAIAGLVEILESMDAENRALRAENELLKSRSQEGVVVVRLPTEAQSYQSDEEEVYGSEKVEKGPAAKQDSKKNYDH